MSHTAMRTTRSHWAALGAAGLALAAAICVVERNSPAIAPGESARMRSGSPVMTRPLAPPPETVTPRQPGAPLRPAFEPPLPDLHRMILYTSPALHAAPTTFTPR
jgi:hypothetical protein